LAEHSPLGFPFEEHEEHRRAALASPLERRPLMRWPGLQSLYLLGHLVPYWLSTPAMGFDALRGVR